MSSLVGNATSFSRERHPPTRGRKKGSVNKANFEAREVARKLVGDPQYRKSLLDRLRKGNAGSLEVTLWHYAYGKPKETVEWLPNLSLLSDDEVEALERLLTRLQRGG